MIRDNLTYGVNFQDESLQPCIPCVEGKQKNVVFPKGVA
jgi:hypothetical protein